MAEAGTVALGAPPQARPGTASIEGRESWVAALVTLGLLSVTYASPLLIVIGLKPIAADLGTERAVPALAGSLTWIGTGLGGILMGWVADRIGVRLTVLFGVMMMALGLAVSAIGEVWTLYVGHGLLIGLIGNGAIYPPLVIYVSRWFDRRRGTALALISSGQYVAGVLWPALFERAISNFGWRQTMLGFAGIILAIALPVAALFLRPAPEPIALGPVRGAARGDTRVLGLPKNLVQLLLGIAGFMCCVPMAVPSAHLVAFCSDIGIPATHGAAMLSVLLACAFVSRQLWGWLADRVGGLKAVCAGSACQAVAITAFLSTQDEVGLFLVSAAFGLGFSGIIPAYVVAVRDLFPSSEASWRVPTQLFLAMSGMAFGGWFAGALYDWYGFYAPAFALGAVFNLGNLAIIGFLLSRRARAWRDAAS